MPVESLKNVSTRNKLSTVALSLAIRLPHRHQRAVCEIAVALGKLVEQYEQTGEIKVSSDIENEVLSKLNHLFYY